MTSSESLRPLEHLKKRLEELSGVEKMFTAGLIAADAIRLAEIYREIAIRRGDYIQKGPTTKITDDEASRLFKGDDGV